MRIVVDTNIVFSALLNTNSKFARIIFQPRSRFNFYTTDQLASEIEEHKSKILSLAGYSEKELDNLMRLVTRKIRFINVKLIPKEIYLYALSLTKDIDIDDTEFVALTEHITGQFWSGDKELKAGLIKKNWTKFISTDELLEKL